MFYIGVDLGQRRDYSVIVIAQRPPQRFTDRIPDELIVRYVERLPLGTRYMNVVERVKEITERQSIALEGFTVVVDMTGVGIAVAEMMRHQGVLGIRPVTITGGVTRSRFRRTAVGMYTTCRNDI